MELIRVDALPLALMAYRGNVNRKLQLTPHKMLMGRPMPSPILTSSSKGPSLENLEKEMKVLVKQMTNVHGSILPYRKTQIEKKNSL